MDRQNDLIAGGDGIDIVLGDLGGKLQLSLAWRGRTWTAPALVSDLFAVEMPAAQRCAPILDRDRVDVAVTPNESEGWIDLLIEAAFENAPLVAQLEIRRYRCAPVLRQRLRLRNTSTQTLRITGTETAAYVLAFGDGDIMQGFASKWGKEFEPFERSLGEEVVVETLTGRSSHGNHPFLLFRAPQDREGLVLSPMWSGNWFCRAEPAAPGATRASAGLADRGFWYDLAPGGSFEAPDVAISIEAWPVNEPRTSALGEVGRRHWYPARPAGAALPTEWNHWFAYTDTDISESVFLENVDAAAELGFELCTLDAGWFGPSDSKSDWFDWRGDWHLINHERFPNGLEALAQRCRERGVAFGIWCEIEGLGSKATLDGYRDRLEARRSGESLGYVCFGNPQTRTWALSVIEALVKATECSWIKLDFNVDPGLGCDRDDHGHGAGSGLYEHVRGYYAFLDEVRTLHPSVVLENCASGGLRIDLGMLSHLHVTYLSDLDWLDHSLQILWGVVAMVDPRACLKFSNSEWGGSHAARAFELRQNYNPRDPNLPLTLTDTYLRSAMLHNFAVSHRLPDLPDPVAHRLKKHVAIYRSVVRPFVESGQLLRLTNQPLRSGGERLPLFQFSRGDEDQHLVFAFRLEGESSLVRAHPVGLSSEQLYRISSPFPDEFVATLSSGDALMHEGIDLAGLTAGQSLCVLIEPEPIGIR